MVRESVRWASRFCRRIWVWDLGSTDGTWEILSQLASEQVCVAQRSDLPFSKTVRGGLVHEIQAQVPEGAWLYKLDADEFVAGDPRPALEAAEREGAESVYGWHLEFHPTLDDVERLRAMGEADWEQLPLFERLRHYRVGWMEWRSAKLVPGFAWDVFSGSNELRKAGGAKLERARQPVLIRHYRYRSPSQVVRRHATRSASRARGHGGFHYDRTADFARYARPAERLRRWSDDDTPPRIPPACCSDATSRDSTRASCFGRPCISQAPEAAAQRTAADLSDDRHERPPTGFSSGVVPPRSQRKNQGSLSRASAGFEVPISHAHRCIFIHIPKTAGTSIERMLGMRGRNKKEDPERLYGRIESHDLKRHALLSGYLQHMTMADLHALFPERPFADYFSFSIVRNPWDRLVSSYFKKDGHLLRTARARGIEIEGLRFDDYVRAVGGLRHAHLQPQHEYLLDEDGKLAVDYVGRFESLAAAFGEICQHLGIRKALCHEKRSNQRERQDYRHYYSPETKQIVERRYARDIELFGYQF